MHTNRNIVKIVASALLLVSLPAGAQVLGGNLGGAANGTVGGAFGRTDVRGAAGGAGNVGFDASGPAGAVRERADNVRGRTLEAGAGAAGTARSRVDSTRRATTTTAHTAGSVGVDASRRTADSAAQARHSVAQSAAAQSKIEPGAQPNGGVLVNEVPTWRADQMPYGGVRDSGNTREGPHYAVREMTELRVVILNG